MFCDPFDGTLMVVLPNGVAGMFFVVFCALFELSEEFAEGVSIFFSVTVMD